MYVEIGLLLCAFLSSYLRKNIVTRNSIWNIYVIRDLLLHLEDFGQGTIAGRRGIFQNQIKSNQIKFIQAR